VLIEKTEIKDNENCWRCNGFTVDVPQNHSMSSVLEGGLST
jgi:hypothetical protein